MRSHMFLGLHVTARLGWFYGRWPGYGRRPLYGVVGLPPSVSVLAVLFDLGVCECVLVIVYVVL